MRISEFFYLHKSDRQVILGCLCIAVIAVLLIQFTGSETAVPAQTVADSTRADTNKKLTSIRYVGNDLPSAPKAERFNFDPNTADSTALLRLGLQPWQVRNIYRYRAAGGVYRRKEDFARLYGLTVKQYRELEPYIHISSDYLPASTLVKDKPFGIDSTIYPQKIAQDEHVVLNTADSATLRTVPGIGVHFSYEILKYGRRLGGYVSVDQLDEIDDFPQEAKRFFVIEGATPRKLNLNRLSLNELRRHPYINYYQARAIVDYRRQHGLLHSLDDLSLLRDFPPEAIIRLQPYVEF
ncbi:MAG: helix-hairpin-helix domain-containing protein [Prevotella sp.]|nr:helix-hairpin-helix domain-containing protein [Prevotella sp.]